MSPALAIFGVEIRSLECGIGICTGTCVRNATRKGVASTHPWRGGISSIDAVALRAFSRVAARTSWSVTTRRSGRTAEREDWLSSHSLGKTKPHDRLQPHGTQNDGRTGEPYRRLGHARYGAAERRNGGWTELADHHEYDDRTRMHVSDDVGISHNDGVSDDDGEAARHHNDNRARWLDEHDSAAWHDHDD